MPSPIKRLSSAESAASDSTIRARRTAAPRLALLEAVMPVVITASDGSTVDESGRGAAGTRCSAAGFLGRARSEHSRFHSSQS